MKKILITLLFSTLFISNTIAQDNSFVSKLGVAAGLSVAPTGGFGLQVVSSYDDVVALRVGFEGFRYKPTKPYLYHLEQEGVDTDLNIYPNIPIGGFSFLVDYYPVKIFYLTGGLMRTNLTAKGKVMFADDIVIDGTKYTPEEVGELNVQIKPTNRLAPYVGLGVGRNISTKKGFAFSLELGIAFSKSYEASVSGTKYFNKVGNKEVKEAKKVVDDFNQTLRDLSWSGLIPVVRLGVSYRFL